MKFTKTLLLACLGLAACAELTGTITLQRAMNVVDKKGKTQQVMAGSYRAEFEYKEDKRQIELEMKDATANKKDVEMKIIIPAGTSIPRDNGSITLLGNEIGQPFDIAGELRTDVDTSGRTDTTETCTYQERERVRYTVCEDRVGRDGKKFRHCRDDWRWEYVTKYGSQEVSYHFVTTTVSLEAKLLEAQSKEMVGALSVDRSDSVKIYDYQGPCLRRRHF